MSCIKAATCFVYDKKVAKYVIIDTALLLETEEKPISKHQRRERELTLNDCYIILLLPDSK